jgi:hypothetical protein
MASAMISLFFLRFWKKTGDRFFFYFASSFLLEGVNRIVLTFLEHGSEQQPFAFLPRLVAFLLILWAIIDKNWIQKNPGRMKRKS